MLIFLLSQIGLPMNIRRRWSKSLLEFTRWWKKVIEHSIVYLSLHTHSSSWTGAFNAYAHRLNVIFFHEKSRCTSMSRFDEFDANPMWIWHSKPNKILHFQLNCIISWKNWMDFVCVCVLLFLPFSSTIILWQVYSCDDDWWSNDWNDDFSLNNRTNCQYWTCQT